MRGRTSRFVGDQRRYLGEVFELTGLVGRQTARSTDPASRFDRDTLEVRILLLDLPAAEDERNLFAIGRQVLVEVEG